MLELGKLLVDHFLAQGSDPTGALANELLECVNNDFPIHSIVPMLTSDIESAAVTGAWIVSELGSRSCVLLEELAALLDHANPKVRFCTVGALINCGMAMKPGLAIHVAKHLTDVSDSVRWQVMSFFAHVDLDVIAQAAQDESLRREHSTIIEGFDLLLSDTGHAEELCKGWITSGSAIQQAFGAAFAVRRMPSSELLLDLAAGRSSTEVVRKFSSDFLELRKSVNLRKMI